MRRYGASTPRHQPRTKNVSHVPRPLTVSTTVGPYNRRSHRLTRICVAGCGRAREESAQVGRMELGRTVRRWIGIRLL
ncbi:hypothetical protein SBA1_190042 [Candidatus Sulfotelmatobacter kueseliae]|uniref:Uncharacterized protein n=1 Tax=Candidatus Sulfotelmatobacter kueseliae TaxID=2042962 RepID=A0A2U3KEF3_9BACT|nr:hypothetical protein SBA1_190042 [Candidatus Sulfotelmatobacter kueseliae]